MARRTFLLVVLIIATFAVSSYAVFDAIISSIEENEQENQQQLLADISNQIELSYELIDSLLLQKRQAYRQLHEFAQSRVMSTPGQVDLPALKEMLEQRSGFPVDLFVIGSNLKIVDTTYLPDRGLDFNLPPFIDVQHFLREAKRTGSIMVGQPNMEFMSKRFKIYTYSALADGRYLELGLIDPEVDGYLRRLVHNLQRRADSRVMLFFEYWGEILSPLVEAKEFRTSGKYNLLEQSAEQTRTDLQIFRDKVRTAAPYRVEERNAAGGETVTYYMQVVGFSTEIVAGLKLRFLAKVTFDDRRISQIKRLFVLFSSLSVLLAVASLLYLAYFIRGWFIKPLNQMLRAIEMKQPVDLRTLPKRSCEFREIAATYNETLANLKQNVLELERQSNIDPLTGIHNRRYLPAAFEQEISRAARSKACLVLAMIDVDFFKTYNDRFGHQQGDQLLIRLAAHLQAHFRRPSDHLCRMGGDEFCVLLNEIDPRSMESIFQDLRDSWNQLLSQDYIAGPAAADQSATLSIGLFVFSSQQVALGWDGIYHQADAALYRAKQGGRNQVIIDYAGTIDCCNHASARRRRLFGPHL